MKIKQEGNDRNRGILEAFNSFEALALMNAVRANYRDSLGTGLYTNTLGLHHGSRPRTLFLGARWRPRDDTHRPRLLAGGSGYRAPGGASGERQGGEGERRRLEDRRSAGLRRPGAHQQRYPLVGSMAIGRCRGRRHDHKDIHNSPRHGGDAPRPPRCTTTSQLDRRRAALLCGRGWWDRSSQDFIRPRPARPRPPPATPSPGHRSSTVDDCRRWAPAQSVVVGHDDRRPGPQNKV